MLDPSRSHLFARSKREKKKTGKAKTRKARRTRRAGSWTRKIFEKDHA